jgi:tripartite-type tricarboxylate transporter receptor subunit TctC
VLEAAGIPPAGGTPEQFAEAIRAEVRQMANLVKASGARVE